MHPRLDSGMMGADIWCRAVSFHREGRNTGETSGTSYTRVTRQLEKDEELTRDKRA